MNGCILKDNKKCSNIYQLSSMYEQRASKLLDQFKKKATLYRTNALLVPHGDDFRFGDAREVHYQFDNLRRLFDYVNTHPELNTRVRHSAALL